MGLTVTVFPFCLVTNCCTMIARYVKLCVVYDYKHFYKSCLIFEGVF